MVEGKLCFKRSSSCAGLLESRTVDGREILFLEELQLHGTDYCY